MDLPVFFGIKKSPELQDMVFFVLFLNLGTGIEIIANFWCFTCKEKYHVSPKKYDDRL